jgi:hypothetical protein
MEYLTTLEMTAEHTHRPLLNISTGELGQYEYYIEAALKRLLTLAQTFEAIVLIDEADVFLEARHKDQIMQNNLVASTFHPIPSPTPPTPRNCANTI